MMGVTYGIVEERYCLNENERVSYGVVVYSNAETDDTATIISSIHDVTSERLKLLTFINLCNGCKLSPIHLQDVIEDFLAD